MSSACLPSPGHLPSLVLTTLPDEPHSDSWQLRAGSAWRSICSLNTAGIAASPPLGMSKKKHGKPGHLFFVFFRKCDPHVGMKTKMLGNQKGSLLEFLPHQLGPLPGPPAKVNKWSAFKMAHLSQCTGICTCGIPGALQPLTGNILLPVVQAGGSRVGISLKWVHYNQTHTWPLTGFKFNSLFSIRTLNTSCWAQRLKNAQNRKCAKVFILQRIFWLSGSTGCSNTWPNSAKYVTS